MLDEDTKEAECSLLRINKVCRFISIAMKVLFLAICSWWAFAAVFMCLSIVNPESFNSVENANPISFVLFLAYGVVIGVMLVALIRMFSEAAKGKSPFTLLQVKRLRVISLMLVLYSILDFCITYSTMAFQFDWLNSGYASVNGNPVVTINLAPLVAAAVVYAFSFVFKYGVLLQEFSDDTL